MDNNLCGTLPDEIGRLTTLVLLNLAQNHISSSLPPTISNMTRLASLYAQAAQQMLFERESEREILTNTAVCIAQGFLVTMLSAQQSQAASRI
jgi:Leucine-rich repeat (LRR) protein